LNNISSTSLKQKIKSFKTSNNIFKKILYYSALFLWRLIIVPYRFLFNPEYRSLILLKYFNKHETHQISNYTEYNRYPDLFTKCKQLMKEKENLKILSYGCSTGEEVFTIREYFSDAFIVGVDINKRNIKKANIDNTDKKIVFSHRIQQSLDTNGPFDIIFALAVLQRTENRNENTVESTNIYPFKKFNTKVSELDIYLKQNGLFVIDHSDYHFEDADIATKYDVVIGDYNGATERNIYDKNNKKMPNSLFYNRIFIKSAT